MVTVYRENENEAICKDSYIEPIQYHISTRAIEVIGGGLKHFGVFGTPILREDGAKFNLHVFLRWRLPSN